ncbi:MAG: tRNA (adenosine(37)-N6)-threonylcarbamoyltransferase complex ATPase subunit type 1 TsaE [Ignavibacteria bacterium]|nr:tRNA (adenosine(37)-N6)-threonylcarbamoyltransferase complex ATPase subunit type 1 TsaE [Ignavibacteria bacterium]MBT8382635.1 tRNA (adenosine(37)-N6)-threonylcarbamoyltransferase complex ATPase subunit type 1 TsaE [Ignavibacteria bacterium]MBT8392843.1 tRNA (adenosine(37)-N6)-threonylcarbamoyltransferase complex ATPase subunit type 1 TsaE [Ignavibacteria bacterium]NNJ52449.1 tRNA (adenosine(37)-N6)-threonylcarbamoyltransferase complex ATPase subunit type 1 TsaE [Ignavibacteriaceae bacterium]
MINYPSKVFIKDENETKNLATDFISEVKIGEKIILNGELGAGKTFFIKAALSHVGIDSVNSPSFAIVNEYSTKIKFYHFDFYRLQNSAELYDIGWQDYLNDDESIMFVEWGNLVPEALPDNRIEISILTKNGTCREFNFARYE